MEPDPVDSLVRAGEGPGHAHEEAICVVSEVLPFLGEGAKDKARSRLDSVESAAPLEAVGAVAHEARREGGQKGQWQIWHEGNVGEAGPGIGTGGRKDECEAEDAVVGEGRAVVEEGAAVGWAGAHRHAAAVAGGAAQPEA